jgi:hypothetical protein
VRVGALVRGRADVAVEGGLVPVVVVVGVLRGMTMTRPAALHPRPSRHTRRTGQIQHARQPAPQRANMRLQRRDALRLILDQPRALGRAEGRGLAACYF